MAKARNDILPMVIVNDSLIEEVDSTKFLGIHLVRELTWAKYHIDVLCSSCQWYLCSAEPITVLLVYQHFSYGVRLWGGCAKYKFDINFRLQKKALSSEKSGLIKEKPTTDAVLTLVDMILEGIEYRVHGIRGVSLKSLSFFLNHRFQVVQISSKSSKQIELSCRIPQGSIFAEDTTFIKHVGELSAELGDTGRWFMNACLRKRVFISSTDCQIQLKMLVRLRRYKDSP
ncbi:hypothetical protein J6590_034956 [Homalodisca vitripennis]|nr:hypothetical protein J6590_034956 [Homalodisca vitripennis]